MRPKKQDKPKRAGKKTASFKVVKGRGGHPKIAVAIPGWEYYTVQRVGRGLALVKCK